MEVKQIHEIVNTISGELIGKSDLVAEDLTNIVDFGKAIADFATTDSLKEQYTKTLIDHIGKVVFTNRVYHGAAPSIKMDAWQYGSIMEKVTYEGLPEATENKSWDLSDGQVYEQDLFTKPTVSAKFFHDRVTFEIPMSFAERQSKTAFDNATQVNAFFSMIHNHIDRSMTVKVDSLIERTINNMIAETIWSEYADGAGIAGLNAKSGMRAVNLLYLYNQKFNKELTPEACVTDMDFIRFTAYTMGLYKKRLSKLSTLFNIGGKERFTSDDMLHIVLLSEFAEAAGPYLQSDTFHDEFVKLPQAESVPYWQGSGRDYSFRSTSKINIKNSAAHSVEISGILGIMFDRDSCGVANLDRRVTTHYNARAEFFNNWYKFDAGYFNDTNENFIVFFAA